MPCLKFTKDSVVTEITESKALIGKDARFFL